MELEEDGAYQVPELAGDIFRIRRKAESHGLTLLPIQWCRASEKDLSQIASFGLPNRFGHWYFGGIYKNLKLQQEQHLISILELVLNTNPVYAYLLEDNTLLQHKMVIAHVMGHVDFFRNNAWFAQSKKDMLSRCERHARIINQLRATHGKDLVDEYITAALTLSSGVDTFVEDPRRKGKRLVYFLRDALEARRWNLRKSDPEYSATAIASRILSMICEEMEYFDLVGRTQIMNEGWASFVERKILQDDLGPQDWVEFCFQFSKRPEPYIIGARLYRSIFEAHGWDGVLDVRRSYEDVQFIEEFLTQEIAEELDLFVKDREGGGRDPSVRAVKDLIIDQKLTKGQPQVWVREMDPLTEGLTLQLSDPDEETSETPEPESREEAESEGMAVIPPPPPRRALDRDRTRLFLQEVHRLWRRDITLEERRPDEREGRGATREEPHTYYFTDRGFSQEKG